MYIVIVRVNCTFYLSVTLSRLLATCRLSNASTQVEAMVAIRSAAVSYTTLTPEHVVRVEQTTWRLPWLTENEE